MNEQEYSPFELWKQLMAAKPGMQTYSRASSFYHHANGNMRYDIFASDCAAPWGLPGMYFKNNYVLFFRKQGNRYRHITSLWRRLHERLFGGV